MGLKSKYTLEASDVEQQARHSQLYAPENVAVPNKAFTEGDSPYAKIQRFAGRFNIEQRGIERVPEDERTDKSLVNVGTMVSLSEHASSHQTRVLIKLVLRSGCQQIWWSPPLPSVRWR